MYCFGDLQQQRGTIKLYFFYQMFGQQLPEQLAKKTELNGTSFLLEVQKTVQFSFLKKMKKNFDFEKLKEKNDIFLQ